MPPTSAYSPKVRSGPAVIFTRIPRAPFRLTSSSSGLRIASSVASRARFGPLAQPVPIIAIPISLITVLTSAKSTFIIPGRLMMSEIPRTAPAKTSSALAKADNKVASLPKIVSSFSLGMVINESTCSLSSRIPSLAISSRRLPSKGNGRVTTATVKMPNSLATSAMIGAAPVPVPPPIPVVINTMSVPCSTSAMRSRSSSAARRPTSGLAPAPNPLVTLVPNCSTVRAATSRNA